MRNRDNQNGQADKRGHRGGASWISAWFWLLVCGVSACGGGGGGTDPRPGTAPPPSPPSVPPSSGDPGGGTWYRPAVSSTWHIQLQGQINTGYDVTLYDVDLFDTPDVVLSGLRAAGRKIICYFSAGTFEDWRDDAASFVAAELGKPLGDFPNERWLDIRSPNLILIIRGRLDIAVRRGCDGVDPDNVDGFANDSGFPLKAADQLAYNRLIAREAHQRHLAVGLKNDLDQVALLAADFDFAVNEQCHEYDECAMLQPFIAAGKPVLNIEYADVFAPAAAFAALCRDAAQRDFHTMVLALNLDDSLRRSCTGN